MPHNRTKETIEDMIEDRWIMQREEEQHTNKKKNMLNPVNLMDAIGGVRSAGFLLDESSRTNC